MNSLRLLLAYLDARGAYGGHSFLLLVHEGNLRKRLFILSLHSCQPGQPCLFSSTRLGTNQHYTLASLPHFVEHTRSKKDTGILDYVGGWVRGGGVVSDARGGDYRSGISKSVGIIQTTCVGHEADADNASCSFAPREKREEDENFVYYAHVLWSQVRWQVPRRIFVYCQE